jgi:hypothetical protein
MSQTKTAVLFTGKIYPEYFNEFIECTSNIKEMKFASIWNDVPGEYIQKLSENNFIIITNNVFYQRYYTPQFIPIVNALEFIHKNYPDIHFVLRTRFDILSYDYSKYLEKTKHLYTDKITVIAGVQTDKVYFLQIMECGNINDMRKMYALQDINDTRYYEKFLMETYSGKTNLTKEEIKEIFHFSLNICIEHNIEFIWIRSEGWKNSLRTIPRMKVIQEYCKDSFIW